MKIVIVSSDQYIKDMYNLSFFFYGDTHSIFIYNELISILNELFQSWSYLQF